VKIQELSQTASTQPKKSKSTPPAHILVCYQNAWQTLTKYNSESDKNHEIYAAATLLNPGLRKRYFIDKWTDNAAQWINPMIERNRLVWETQYKVNTPLEAPKETQSALDRYIYYGQQPRGNGDQFQQYIEGDPTPPGEWRGSSIFAWWDSCPYPELRQWAFDALSVPAMSAEVERVFSSAKRTLSSDRNRTGNDLLEAIECLRHWHHNGVVS
jgi:hAT family C-terminal dimerisation region